ncbi:SDR family oxidoreductase [Flavobacterium wongokense]|uniref:SDR family oxidoreductase n=1 Tax=Flavobacterium wongokense TaxID=2910674 RepID=UPI001F203F47|nr:SDR family oxidoreductase [Flavobacterium sp. WG47]MCF6131572.1 SDR family oxidoreductase [Flavobacterium sp. WG47]
MKQISILGCGWLGLPLAKSLIGKGFSVKGSTTSADKIAVLKDVGIEAFQIEVSESRITGGMDSFLKNSEILIIDIPPKLKNVSSENFVKKIQNLIPFIEKSTIRKVVFISSTSVYGDDNSDITEATKPQPDTESGKQLLEAERLLQSNSDFKTMVIRFGGLIGENRHPIHFLAGKQNIENPKAPVNLIHQADCIGIIEKIIELDCRSETFNAVAPFHPTRKEYYIQKAIELGLPLPGFAEETTSFGKIIDCSLLEKTLNYKFQYPNL